MAASNSCTKCGLVAATALRSVCADCYRVSQREYAKAKREGTAVSVPRDGAVYRLGPVIYDWTGISAVGRCTECAGWSAFGFTLGVVKESVEAHLLVVHGDAKRAKARAGKARAA